MRYIKYAILIKALSLIIIKNNFLLRVFITRPITFT